MSDTNTQLETLYTCPTTRRRVVAATAPDFRERLNGIAITNAWCDSTFLNDPVWRHNRRAIRLSMEESPEIGGRGKGGSLKHQVGAGAMSVPDSDYYLKADTDQTLIERMVDWGYVHNPRLFADADDLFAQVSASGRKLLGTDDYPPMFSPVLMNQPEWFITVGDKANLANLVDGHFLPTESVIDLEAENWEAELRRLSEHGRRPVYFKDVDGQHGGTGVTPLFSDQGFDPMAEAMHRLIADRRKSVSQVNREVDEVLAQHADNSLGLRKLSTRFVLQRGFGDGMNMSFQVFLDPRTPDVIPVLSVSEQRTSAGGKNLGNRFMPVNQETVPQAVASAITSTVERIWQQFPEAFGCLMWDYFDVHGGAIVMYDPALRPSASTPGLRYRMEIEEKHGRTPHIEGDWKFETGKPGLSFAEVCEVLGDLLHGPTVMEKVHGLIPLGWNHIAGDGRFVAVAHDKPDFDRVVDEALGKLGLAYGDGARQVS